MRNPSVLISACALAAIFAGCAEPSTHAGEQHELAVLAAASLKESFDQIDAQFASDNPGWKVNTSFGGSQDLALEIENDGPADVFASADMKQMKEAEKSGRIAEADVKEFAQNSLVVVASLKSSVLNLEDLARPKLKLVLAAKEVPVGLYTVQMLDKVKNFPGFAKAVLNNVASYEQDVRAVLTKVKLGEADAGVVYATDALTAGDAVRTITISAEENVPAHYYVAPIRGSQYDAGQRFVKIVLSSTGRQVLSQHGFLTPK